jgi:hypothetical protein
MRQFNRFGGCSGWHVPGFTEVEIMKFTKPRDQDSVAGLVRGEPRLFPSTTRSHLMITAEPACLLAPAKGGLS